MENLFISYDLDAPGQNYRRVIAAIESIGQAVVVHRSLYYVKTSMSSEDAGDLIRKAIDQNDRLIVINARDATWFNLLPDAGKFIQERWNS